MVWLLRRFARGCFSPVLSLREAQRGGLGGRLQYIIYIISLSSSVANETPSPLPPSEQPEQRSVGPQNPTRETFGKKYV